MRLVVAVVGPTAVGKSRLALSLSQSFSGEVVNADSRQVYRFMDIGTAKPSPQEQSLVPNHLIDIVDPAEPFNVATYKKLADDAINMIHTRGKVPFLTGGTGMYVWSVLEGWTIPEVPPDIEMRTRMEARAAGEGRTALHRELQEIDPAAAAKIHPHNLRRIIRALEVHQSTGKRFSEVQARHAPDFNSLIIGLTASRRRLHNRIDERVDKMIEHGLVEEVSSLMQRGYHLGLPSMATVGYRQIGQYLQGGVRLPEAIQQIKYETHRLAIHQYAWFRLSDPRIDWFNVEQQGFEGQVAEIVKARVNE